MVSVYMASIYMVSIHMVSIYTSSIYMACLVGRFKMVIVAMAHKRELRVMLGANNRGTYQLYGLYCLSCLSGRLSVLKSGW